MPEDNDEKLELLIASLTARLGRLPTEDEVVTFINGSKAEREAVWNGRFRSS